MERVIQPLHKIKKLMSFVVSITFQPFVEIVTVVPYIASTRPIIQLYHKVVVTTTIIQSNL